MIWARRAAFSVCISLRIEDAVRGGTFAMTAAAVSSLIAASCSAAASGAMPA